MNYKILLLSTYFTLSHLFSAAQPDTILLGYPAAGVGSSVINETRILSDNRIIFTQFTTDKKHQAFIVDSIGGIVYVNDLDEVAGFTIFSSIYIIEGIGKYVFIGNAARDSVQYFISFSLDSTLENIALIDTVRLENDTWLSFENMKFNPGNELWETFGVVRRISNSANMLEYFYAGIDKNYKFNKFKKFKTKYKPNYVFEFYWVESVRRYMFSCFNQSTILVDEDINFVYEDAIRVPYIENGSPNVSIFIMYNCTDDENNIVFCYGKESWGAYTSAFVWLDIKADTIILANAIPLNTPPLGVQVESHMRKDGNGNYLISGTNNLPWLNGPSNTLKVVKYTPNQEKIWEFSYSDDKGFVIWDMEIDHNNDIVVVGDAWNMYGDGQIHGFLMKIYSHGTLSSYQEIPDNFTDKYKIQITPNPAVSKICIQSSTEQARIARFWDVSGRLVLTENIQASPHCFDLPGTLLPGFYAAEVLFADGRRSVQKVVVTKN